MCKPDSVIPDESGIPIIYLGRGITTKALSAYPLQLLLHAGEQPGPTKHKCVLRLECTWHFSPQGLSHDLVTRTMRALLPHVFTLISPFGATV